ncbi:MAG TPA: hypothetical protein VHV08_06350 [Pirellulales bacterium]|nr:hypothetical protein [Pirellulales bacterium]
MDEILQEFVDSRGVTMRIDRQQGILRGVKLLGFESRNGRRYSPAALAQAAGLYEGAKVNVNHPKGNPLAARDYQDRLGQIRSVAVRDGQGLFGDFHFNPKHALAEQLLWDAEHAPENVCFSHNVEARVSRQGGQPYVEAILKVQSVDLVADPATTRGLFEHAPTRANRESHAGALTLEQATLEDLRTARPDLLEALIAAASEQLGALRDEVDRLRACEAARERRSTVARLLREFQMPDPDLADAIAKPLVSDLFLASLLAAPNESSMRALVQERAEMIATVRQTAPAAPVRPVSREQHRFDPLAPPVMDALAFAKAIT